MTLRLHSGLLVVLTCLVGMGVGPAYAQESGTGSSRVIIRSTPTGGTILTGEADPVGVTPDTLTLEAGDYILQVGQEGYQFLSHRVDLEPGQVLSLEFILLPTPPEPKTPEDFDLEYWPLDPTTPETGADGIREKYNALTETFTVFPLMPGIMGMLAFDDSQGFPAEEMFYSGLVMVAGSYFLGKYKYNKTLKEIQGSNAAVAEANEYVTQHNLEVDRTIARDHAQAVIEWQSQADGRGVVIEGR